MSSKGGVVKSLGEVLRDLNLISVDDLNRALKKQAEYNAKQPENKVRIGSILMANKLITQTQLQEALKEQNKRKQFEFKTKGELEDIYGRLNYQLEATGTKETFVDSEHEAEVIVAESPSSGHPFILVTMSFQETNLNALLAVRRRVTKAYSAEDNSKVELVTLHATKDVLILYRQQKGLSNDTGEDGSQTDAELEFENLVKRAYEAKAVDLHFFRRSDNCRVRFRVWGSMRDHEDWEPKKADDILSVGFSSFGKGGKYSHWKSNTKQRIRIKVTYSQFITLDCRYEHAPGDDGAYHACIRILANDRRDIDKLINLVHLGFTTAQAKSIESAASAASGMVILAGPTGSGKSTTLAGVVKYLNRNDDVNILTVESPIERELPAFQTAVSDDDDADPKEFAMAIKSNLRRDPDCMMVGEIRDQMSASAAATGAQTGHTLLTTVHAQSAIEIVERLSSPALGLSAQTIGSPSFISILIFQMLLPVMDSKSKTRLTAGNIDEHLTAEEKDRLLALVPDFDAHEICVRGTSREFPEGIAEMTICAEVVVPDPKMRRLFRSLDLSEALEQWLSLGREKNQGLPLDNQVTGLTAASHAVSKMLSGMIDPRDIEGSFGHLNLLSNDF